MKQLEKYLSLKYLLFFSLAAAVITAGVLIALSSPQWSQQLNENDFGLSFDIAVLVIGYFLLAGIIFACYVLGCGLGWFYGMAIEAAALAMVTTQQIYYTSLALLKAFSKLVITQAALEYAESFSSPQYLARQRLLDSLAAKLSSQAKFPYQLYPVSCILLN